MDYVLLTGATGLVGRYLLKELLGREFRVAVVVRPGKLETGRERVDKVMRFWERDTRHALPRPVVLEGDLTKPGLGLSDSSRNWVTEHVATMLHCAASMTFREDQHGEPFRTNVGGMENVLGLCRDTDIRQFHHVSTCYICGLRNGKILESEVNLGQRLGNVYEQSKLRAEEMVREAKFLDQLTVYRPSSVVGDSRTGYVTSCHGFYLPLQLAHLVASRVHVRDMKKMNDRFRQLLGLEGHEGKNLVPVDWLAAAIVKLVADPQKHGKTYQLASEHPVPVSTIQELIPSAIESYHPHALRDSEGADLTEYEPLFQEYMSIYESHWRDEPKVDVAHTREALPDLPCPVMDEETLMRIARYPIERNFQLSKFEKANPVFDVEAHLQRKLVQGGSRASENRVSLNLQVSGSGGGEWRLDLDDQGLVAVNPGRGVESLPSCRLTTQTWQSLVEHRLSTDQSINSGYVLLEAPNGNMRRLTSLVEQLWTAA